MSHGRSAEGDHVPVDAHQNTPSAELFNAERNAMVAPPPAEQQANVGDRSQEARLARINDPGLNDARTSVNETVAKLMDRSGQCTSAEVKVLSGAIGLGEQIGAFPDNHKQQLALSLEERAAAQNNPLAANSLRSIAEFLTKTSSVA